MSIVQDILDTQWDNYICDPCPQDRRMKLIDDLGVYGYSSENICFFINDVVKKYVGAGTYLEAGTCQGRSLVSAALFNEQARCIGIDNFSELNGDGLNEGKLHANIERSQCKNVQFIKGDYRDVINGLSGLIDVYFYDGCHEYEHQLNGLNIMLPHLSQDCVIIVDDVNWMDVRMANNDFLRANPDFRSVARILTENQYGNWWNGFEIMQRGDK